LGDAPVRERTAVVVIPFPSDATGGSYPPWVSTEAPPPPTPDNVTARLDRIEAALAALAARKDPNYIGTVGTTTITLRPSREP
jgi:hypothetical protein